MTAVVAETVVPASQTAVRMIPVPRPMPVPGHVPLAPPTAVPAGGPVVRRSRGALRQDPVHEAAEDLCAAVFRSLRRRDQRDKARLYVRGLLAAEGRKSIRNIALQTGGPASEQSLHHFISDSTWDWQPIRAELTQYLGASAPLTAWVAQPMAIPKGGEQSVGAGRHFDPHRGQMFRGQQAFGVWFGCPELVTPVGWRLRLPEEGPGARAERPVAFPGGPGYETYDAYEDCAVTGVLETVRQAGLAPRPVVLDVRGIGTRSTMNRFAEARVPVLARIDPATRLVVTDPAVPGYGVGTLAARNVLHNVRGLRTPVDWSDPQRPGERRTTYVAAVRVMIPDPSAARRRHLMLVGEWTEPGRPPAELWITDLIRPAPAVLLRLSKQARRVSVASATSAQEIGMRDFSGRSLPGWHRHVTMASVAHAARAMAESQLLGPGRA
ncbi:IS701 family transposase [Streptomyces sp. NPDC012888]|uniref:IS701 family transposase n=1 Tax=Streptomyces sp. NPDC012888 TaxID=3364855 RepID=UPI003685FC3E